MRCRSVRRVGGVAVFLEAAHVTGDALALMEQLHRAMAGPIPERLVDQRVRGAVEVLIDADVIVDVNAHLTPVGVFVRPRRQGLQCGLSTNEWPSSAIRRGVSWRA